MKKVISLLMSLVMAASLIATLPASAESYFENDSVATAIPISLNQTYPINYGVSPSYGTDCFVKITLPSKGYISTTVNKPIVNQKYEDMKIVICNSQGIKIAEHYQTTEAAGAIKFSIGLNKGTYYINIINQFSSYEEPQDVTTLFRVDFKADNYCEAEPNNGVTTATPMTLGKSYLGFIEPNGGNYDDYYKFVIPSTRKVRFYIGNYTNVVSNSGTNTYFRLFKSNDAYESSMYSYRGTNDYNSSIYKFNMANNKMKILSSGTAYVDKYLTAGTYYIKVTSFLDTNSAYSISVNNAPATTVGVQKPKSNKPAQVANLKLKKGGKATAKVTWKKVKGAKGYQVKYSTSKKFKKSKTKTKTVKKNKITLKKLTKNKYYVKVRAYKKVKGKKVYGKYSRTLMLYRMW